jgi:hypothetical protein
MVVAQHVPQPRPLKPMRRSHRGWVILVLTISKLKRWSINYYIDTARAAETASRDVARAGGGLGEYYCEHETRTPTWLLAGDTPGANAAEPPGSIRTDKSDAKVIVRQPKTPLV